MENNWISVEDKLSEDSRKVIATYINSYDKRRTVMAFYARKFDIVSDSDNDDGIDEYCEQKDEYYLKEGWYELIDNWSDYAFVVIHEGEVDYWMSLPQATK